MGGRTIYRSLSPEGTPLQTGIDRWPPLRTVPEKWISHTYLIWLWGYALFKISPLRTSFYGTKWLFWRPRKQSPTFHWKYRTDKGLTKKRGTKYNIEGRSARAGLLWTTLYALIHSFKADSLQSLLPAQFLVAIFVLNAWNNNFSKIEFP
jgi:hypothetical protein